MAGSVHKERRRSSRSAAGDAITLIAMEYTRAPLDSSEGTIARSGSITQIGGKEVLPASVLSPEEGRGEMETCLRLIPEDSRCEAVSKAQRPCGSCPGRHFHLPVSEPGALNGT